MNEFYTNKFPVKNRSWKDINCAQINSPSKIGMENKQYDQIFITGTFKEWSNSRSNINGTGSVNGFVAIPKDKGTETGSFFVPKRGKLFPIQWKTVPTKEWF